MRKARRVLKQASRKSKCWVWFLISLWIKTLSCTSNMRTCLTMRKTSDHSLPRLSRKKWNKFQVTSPSTRTQDNKSMTKMKKFAPRLQKPLTSTKWRRMSTRKLCLSTMRKLTRFKKTFRLNWRLAPLDWQSKSAKNRSNYLKTQWVRSKGSVKKFKGTSKSLMTWRMKSTTEGKSLINLRWRLRTRSCRFSCWRLKSKTFSSRVKSKRKQSLRPSRRRTSWQSKSILSGISLMHWSTNSQECDALILITN